MAGDVLETAFDLLIQFKAFNMKMQRELFRQIFSAFFFL